MVSKFIGKMSTHGRMKRYQTFADDPFIQSSKPKENWNGAGTHRVCDEAVVALVNLPIFSSHQPNPNNALQPPPQLKITCAINP